jgi:hypothetical protein
MAAGLWEFTLTGNGESRIMQQCITPDQANLIAPGKTPSNRLANARAQALRFAFSTRRGLDR